MKRRSVLLATITAGIAGCTGSPNNDSTFNKSAWKYEIPGDDLTVSKGKLYGSEKYPHDDKRKEKLREETDISGRVFSLDLENGERNWTHGSVAYMHEEINNIIIEDAIYHQTINDVTSWVSAVEFDGTERWTGSEGHSTLGGTLKNVTKNAVYIQESSNIKMIDPIEGDVLRSDVGGIYFDTAAKDTPKTVYVWRQENSDEVLVALDTDDRSAQWRYRPVDNYSEYDVFAGVVYATDNGSVIAIADGEERWQVKLSKTSNSLKVLGATSNSAFVKDASHLYSLDVSKGTVHWKQEMRSPRRRGDLRISGDRIYVARDGEQEVSAFDLEEGAELWETDIGSEVKSWGIVNKGILGSEESLLVQTEKELYKVNTDGEVAQTWTPGEVIHDFVVDEFIIISTDSGIHALEP